MKILDLPIHLRPREKLIQKGAANLKEKELLGILLRTGNKSKNAIELSEYVLSKYPLKSLLQLTYEDLVQIKGIDVGKACTLLAGFELAKRALEIEDTSLPLIQSPEDVVIKIEDIKKQKKEHFVALFLNARNQLLHKEIISIGTLTASLVHPREVFEPALRYSAASVLVAHNHPSGDTQPSDEDIQITERLIKAGSVLGIELIDHIIVSSSSYVSLKELDIIK